MQELELLAPARDKQIGIAAVDCGADAIYIAGPDFGARKDAGNSIADVGELCRYAHMFGVRVFATFNILLRDSAEIEKAHQQMLLCQDEAGVDAFIVRDPHLFNFSDIHIPLHASTQCAIRTPERALELQEAGMARLVLERELSLKNIQDIRSATECELEFFVHGALCVCYSGECRLSERIDGRSADRGECIQACRSLYDLVDEDGKVLVKHKALLSLKDYNLKSRLEELAEAGVCSFKIEGRLKNESYVRNVVRDYSLALDALVAKYPDKYCRSSFGQIVGGFKPDTTKTFNRGYTELFLDGKRSQGWSSMDAPKSMGEELGTIQSISHDPASQGLRLRLKPYRKDIELHNGDGFAFATKGEIIGFRADRCEGVQIFCKSLPELREGLTLYRNLSTAFEHKLEVEKPQRELRVALKLNIHSKYVLELEAHCEDGSSVVSSFNADVESAQNTQRAESMLREQLSKRSGIYNFTLSELNISTPAGNLPLLSASTINSIRRLTAEDLDAMGRRARPLGLGHKTREILREAPPQRPEELMRSKYCIRFELGLCPLRQKGNEIKGAEMTKKLFLVNNGRRLALGFDCARCEMTLTEVQK